VLAAFTVAAQQRFVARVPMRDGVRLSTNVFLPQAEGRYSAILVRTPYGKGRDLIPNYRVFIENGYAVVVQDVRGRYESGGQFRPFTQEMADGDDTLNWIAKQSWSDGRISMIGGSYVGIVQWRAALSGNPHLVSIFPVVSGSDEYRDRFYSRGGAFKLGHRLLWTVENVRPPTFRPPSFADFVRHLPLRTADRYAAGRTVDFWQEAMTHPSYDAYWRSRSTFERLNTMRVPAFIVGGWYDNYVQGDLEAFSELTRYSTAHRILIGPWAHNMTAPFPSGIRFGKDAFAPMRRYQLGWLEHWMRKPQPASPFGGAPVRIFVMGINRWRDEEHWPLRRAKDRAFYLTSYDGANSAEGDGMLVTSPAREDDDVFTYDPRHPVPTAGGAICCNPMVFPWGPMDQRPVEMRHDVLVYTTPPLRDNVEVTGPIRTILHVSTTAPDTDFTAKLVDVFPDGHARNLCDGVLRLRYRDGLTAAKLAKPGQIYRIAIETGVTSNVFLAGHRIRLELSSSNFPRFDRNPNTGRPVADEREFRVARQTVYHGSMRPSHILLPVVGH
jgi:putative CocE/NonD family hydrolase